MTRIKAASTHLVLSLFIFSIVVFVLIYFWYPSPYFIASGGWQGLKIAASVDLVLGPLLTFIIFDVTKEKKKLVTDLLVIAIMQFMALAWGVSTIYQQRPLAIVYWETSFYTVPASAFTNQNINSNYLKKFGQQPPVLIYAQKPQTASGLIKMGEITAQKQLPPYHQTELYRPLSEHFTEIEAYQADIAKIMTSNSEIKDKLTSIVEGNNRKIDDYSYFLLRSKYRYIILLFNHQGNLVDYISAPFKPA